MWQPACQAVLRNPPSRFRQLGALLLVLPLGLLVLGILNLSLSYAIWGELVVAWSILGFAILGATRVADGPLKKWLHVDPLPLWQALSWALVVVVGLPLSYTFTPLGWVLLLGQALSVLGRAGAPRPQCDRSARAHFSRSCGSEHSSESRSWSETFATFFHKSVIDDATAAKTRRRQCLRPTGSPGNFRLLLFFDSAEQFVPDTSWRTPSRERIGISGCKTWPFLNKEDRKCSRSPGPRSFAHSRLDYVTVDVFPLGHSDLAGGARSAVYYHVSRGGASIGRATYVELSSYYTANPSPVAVTLLVRGRLQLHPDHLRRARLRLGRDYRRPRCVCRVGAGFGLLRHRCSRLEWSSSTTHSTSTRSRTPGRSHKRSGPSSAIRRGRSTARNDHWSSSHSTATRRIGCRAPPVPVRNQRDRCPSDGMVCFRGRTTALVALTRQA